MHTLAHVHTTTAVCITHVVHVVHVLYIHLQTVLTCISDILYHSCFCEDISH